MSTALPPSTRLPVTVLSGFLGAGKTTQPPVGPLFGGAVPPRIGPVSAAGRTRQIDAPRGHVIPCLDDRPCPLGTAIAGTRGFAHATGITMHHQTSFHLKSKWTQYEFIADYHLRFTPVYLD
ncbi:hypothetical protein [Burkholderia sp. Tr-849]|uniref:hypothetical protein n=1 Tax=Burkholderia sp. Tr-849 TaxID=2608330 RepID=UPI001964BB82|nr:hypothetical protein [Burkholderia sp. Tr-849]